MQIGLSSIVGDGFGRGFFHISDLPSGACPPAGYSGTTLTGIEYPIAQGGAQFNHPVLVAQVPSQTCDVPVNDDGSCGTYNDWANLSNVAYKPNGTSFYVYDVNQPSSSTTEVPTGSNNYIPNGTVDVEYLHDGAGSYYNQEVNFNYYPDATLTGVTSYEETEVPSLSYNYYGTGRSQNYLWDGSGGYYVSGILGSYHPAGTLIWENAIDVDGTSVEIPEDSENYYYPLVSGDRYEWNGSGGYNYFSSWYYASGTYITDDGVNAYYWDGSGGYYSVPISP